MCIRPCNRSTFAKRSVKSVARAGVPRGGVARTGVTRAGVVDIALPSGAAIRTPVEGARLWTS
jgi:hypothetical protein